MVIGATAFGTALIVELARRWRVHAIDRVHPRIILVDPAAGAAVARLHRRFPFLVRACAFDWHDLPIETLLDGDLPEEPPDRVYLCCEDEEVALKVALTMDHFWRRGSQSVVVRLGRLGLLARAFEAPDEDPLLDDLRGALHLFDAVTAGSDPHVVEDSLVERLARAIHERYLYEQLRQGTEWQSTPAMCGWAELAGHVRAANRAQAQDMGSKLAEVGCALAPNPIWGSPVALDGSVVDRLAQLEHLRWCAYMREHGYRPGPQRDDARRVHPDLAAWNELSEPAREKDRDTVREMPRFLADEGFQIVRVQDGMTPSANGNHPRPAR
jgi:hypothetical protein